MSILARFSEGHQALNMLYRLQFAHFPAKFIKYQHMSPYALSSLFFLEKPTEKMRRNHDEKREETTTKKREETTTKKTRRNYKEKMRRNHDEESTNIFCKKYDLLKALRKTKESKSDDERTHRRISELKKNKNLPDEKNKKMAELLKLYDYFVTSNPQLQRQLQ
ncbi:hypothetical protein C2G38_2218994 [Gigaspora rosea]|uniref:Uncharacterized protein n=1 Tax=Gigaspora rosea TaxID=44941 RepID=A0A397UEX9_9GLOM|nr:hypothetical protein C2G38_2218994 [Gigaspora rosea]